MSAPEFSCEIDARRPPASVVRLDAGPEERAALARRFGLVSVARLEAEVALQAQGDAVSARGRLQAEIVQSCAVSGEDLPMAIDEPLELRFVPERPIDADELELDEGELNEIPYAGDSFDLGEAVAQTLGLAIDPFAVGPQAEQARKEAGILDEDSASSGPFAALAALKKPD
jgi:uncharacterized metal-binding protein YceD (DUF177 family)